ncbi:MAG TPA: DUF805 domain-containing protein [Bradyrhizobium sp.]|uniref:DUF805 domain-containing protein n=1 Tax=Bradyrhizobium sp. TaxID=376 RepID=UPI002D802E75|nr:DUF805 domain-containing protein [Bradyrhizobium sp.]HET7885759.1 DUF805 domain-containing protein [Bradyrhizobium sp.]
MAWIWLLFSFRGRTGRARYLVVELALLTFWLTLWLKQPEYLSSPWEHWLAAIALIWINLAVTAKRLHDRDRSGWWAVAVFAVNRLSYLYYGLFFGLAFGVDISMAAELLLVTAALALSLLQTWAIIELFFLPGTEGANRFGRDPTATPSSPIGLVQPAASVPDFLISRR